MYWWCLDNVLYPSRLLLLMCVTWHLYHVYYPCWWYSPRCNCPQSPVIMRSVSSLTVIICHLGPAHHMLISSHRKVIITDNGYWPWRKHYECQKKSTSSIFQYLLWRSYSYQDELFSARERWDMCISKTSTSKVLVSCSANSAVWCNVHQCDLHLASVPRNFLLLFCFPVRSFHL